MNNFFWCAVFFLCAVNFFESCSSKEKSTDPIKLKQYTVQGEMLYAKYCANCHQKNGSGLGRVYPPVNQSDFIDNNFEKVVCIIKYGVQGELMVNGKVYNQAMPALPQLSDIEVAEIATYLYNNFGRDRGIVDVKQATKILEGCSK
jgi:mono/diheme cytochrome c family protein